MNEPSPAYERPPAPMMTAEEARRRVTAINSQLNNVRALLLDFHDREGWKALGYESWVECVKEEFGQSKAYLYRQLGAAQIEQRILEAEKSPIGDSTEISPIGEKSDDYDDYPPFDSVGPAPIPESHLRPLASLPEEEQATIYHLAKETAPDGRLTAAHVERVVEEVTDRQTTTRKKRKESPAPESGYELPPPTGSLLKRVSFIISCIDSIRDDDPKCKEALSLIADHIQTRQ